MAPRILVVDRNEAFATMLREMLEIDGGYEVEAVHAGSEALASLSQTDFDLTIVDMDLEPEDMSYQDLVQSVRDRWPTMRLVLIPLMGEELPAEAHSLNLQGTLSKPFFADDLLPTIEQALSQAIEPTGFPPPPEEITLQPAAAERMEDAAADVQAVLNELAHETNASLALLLSTQAGKQGVVAHASKLNGTGLNAVTYLILAAVQAAQAIAHFLGQPDVPYRHNMFESDAQRLYIMARKDDLMLVVVTPVSTPLGTIRHNLRRAGRDLDALALT